MITFNFHLTCFHRPNTQIYKTVMPHILDAVEKHKANLKPGEPQLNYCDPAVMVCNFLF